MARNKVGILEFSDLADSLGKTYIVMLFVSGAIWAFIAINNFDAPNIFKLALIYSLLLIFGFFGIIFDRNQQKLGLDSRIWESGQFKKQLLIGIIFFAVWYLVFIQAGFSVATAQSVGGTTFAVNPTLNFFLITILGPLAEDIFFFGIINITLILIIRSAFKDKIKSFVTAGLILASYFLFQNVPNSLYFLAGSAAAIIIGTLINNPKIQHHLAFLGSALFIGAVIFPAFHAYAYQLNEKNYVAAGWFGMAVCLLVAYIGLFPVDLAHIANNMLTAG